MTEAAGGSGGGSAPQLHVSGNELADASGNQVVLHGMDRSGAEFACVQNNGIFDGPVDQASITAMKSWTHVRPALHAAISSSVTSSKRLRSTASITEPPSRDTLISGNS